MAASYAGRIVNTTGAIVWGVASATIMGLAQTKALSLDALANGSARMGVYADLGADWHQEWVICFLVETGTAPTAGNAAYAYMAESLDGTNFPGKVSGADAAYPTTVVDNLRQLGNPVSSLIATNDGNTVLQQLGTIYVPYGRYVAPVVYNALGQAFRDEGTDSNNNSGIVMVPAKQYLDTVEP